MFLSAAEMELLPVKNIENEEVQICKKHIPQYRPEEYSLEWHIVRTAIYFWIFRSQIVYLSETI